MWHINREFPLVYGATRAAQVSQYLACTHGGDPHESQHVCSRPRSSLECVRRQRFADDRVCGQGGLSGFVVCARGGSHERDHPSCRRLPGRLRPPQRLLRVGPGQSRLVWRVSGGAVSGVRSNCHHVSGSPLVLSDRRIDGVCRPASGVSAVLAGLRVCVPRGSVSARGIRGRDVLLPRRCASARRASRGRRAPRAIAMHPPLRLRRRLAERAPRGGRFPRVSRTSVARRAPTGSSSVSRKASRRCSPSPNLCPRNPLEYPGDPRPRTAVRRRFLEGRHAIMPSRHYAGASAATLMSSFSKIAFAAPWRATWSIARAIRSVVVTWRGKSVFKSGKSGPKIA
jgi:hypothetical protein